MENLQFLFNVDVMMSGDFQQKARVLNGEFSRITQAGQALQQRLGSINAFTSLKQKIESNSQALQKSSANLSAMSKKLSEARARTELYGSRVQVMKNRVAELSREYPKNSAQVREAQRQLKALTDTYTKSKQEVKEYEQSQKNLEKQHASLAAQAERDQQAHDRLKESLTEAGVRTHRLAQEQQTLQDAYQKVVSAQKQIEDVRGKLTWGNFKADLLKSMAIIMTLRQPVEVSMNFEQAMSQIRAVANPTQEQQDALRAQALELGRTTQFSITQAANSQENLLRLGQSVTNVLNMMPEVLNLAAADGIEIAQTASILGGILSGYMLDSTETKRIADILAYTSGNSATNAEKAGTALQGVSGTARLLNISPEKAASYIGTLAQFAQAEATEAATILDRSLAALASRTGETDKVLKEFNINTSNGKSMRLLEEVISELYQKTKSLGSDQQLAAFNKVFGTAYGPAMLKMYTGIESGFTGNLYQGLMQNKDNAALNMSRIRNDNLKGDLTNLSSAWEGFMESVGKPLQEWSRFIIQNITGALSWITGLIKGHEEISTWAVRIGAILAGWKVVAVVWKYTSLIGQLFKAKLALGAAETAAQAAGIGGAMAKSGGIISSVWALISAHPFVAIATAVAGLGILIYQNWDAIKETWNKIRAKIDGVVVWFNGLTLGNIFDSVGQWCDDTINYVMQKWEEFKQWFIDLLPSLNPFSTTGAQKQFIVNQQALNMAFGAPPGLGDSQVTPHATGGILTQPHIGLVAEAGPEAIIPLRDKSRGVPLLMRAAELLGLNFNTNAPAESLSRFTNTESYNNSSSYIRDVLNNADGFIQNFFATNSSDSRSIVSQPQITVNVNVTSSAENSQSLAQDIAQKVREVLRDITSYEERVSFA